MKIIIGLGNPGKQYEKTWHNLGFLCVDNFAASNGFENFKPAKKLSAEIAIGKIGREKIILAKPQTFMNLSGDSVSLILNYYKCTPLDLIVVHDDIDLPLGKIRIAKNSSAGGHNGIKSIIEKIKSKEFSRIKIGIRTEMTEIAGAADYVLQKFSGEKKATEEAIKKAASALESVLKDGVERTMNQFN